MFTLTPAVRIFVCLQSTDMRKGFDGLAAAAREILREDPLSGHVFVFFNRRRNRAKALVWDRNGLCIWYKRLEKGRFQLAFLDKRHPNGKAQVEASELTLVLDGIDLSHARRRARFVPKKSA